MFNKILSIIIIFSFSLSAFGQCKNFSEIKTKLKFGDGKNAKVIKAWRYGNLATVVVVPGVNVNPDGSPRAYSVGNLGLVDIQNGVKIWDKGKFITFDTYLDRYGESFTKHWLEAEKKNFAKGTKRFDAFALYSSSGQIVGNGEGSPQVQDIPGSPIRYYVSTTSTVNDYPQSDQRRYLDSGAIPAFVIPGIPKGATVVDPLTDLLASRQFGWAYSPTTRHSTYAIGGDTGPAAKFGEATMAFQQMLRFGEILPLPKFRADANYKVCQTGSPTSTWTDCLYPGFEKFGSRGRIKATAFSKPTIFVFFDKAVKLQDKTITFEAITNKGKVEMNKLGGEQMLISCLSAKAELKNLFDK